VGAVRGRESGAAVHQVLRTALFAADDRSYGHTSGVRRYRSHLERLLTLNNHANACGSLFDAQSGATICPAVPLIGLFLQKALGCGPKTCRYSAFVTQPELQLGYESTAMQIPWHLAGKPLCSSCASVCVLPHKQGASTHKG
jgi:hypothetical protein